MKKHIMKRTLSLVLALVMVFALSAAAFADDAEGGTIMYLSNISSGPAYDAITVYAEDILSQLGYDFQVVYADPFNDPTGNLNAVKNAMTKDVVGLIAIQDGGIQNIMEEYPDLYVVGFNSDMAAVYNEDGAAHGLLENDHWLGTIVDGCASGVDEAHEYSEAVIAGGYKKVATISFPPYAYPQHAVAAATFREDIEAYNATAADEDKIEVVGENKILEFSPLDESWFMEEGNSDLDAIVGICAGTQFIYPTMKTAIANGTCSPDTKLLTGGFENAPDIIADYGGDGVIQWNRFSPAENVAWAIVMLDNALQGKQYADFEPVRIDSEPFIIDSKEDVDNVMAKSLYGSPDPARATITFEDLQTVLTRYTPDATLAQLNDLFHSEQITVEGLAK